MYDMIDGENAGSVPFKDSQYYRQKRHLGGFMTKENLRKLKRQIKELDEHRREAYKLSPDPKQRQR